MNANKSKVLSILAIELMNDYTLQAGEAVQGSNFVKTCIVESVAHLINKCPDKTLLYSHSKNVYLAIVKDIHYENDIMALKQLIKQLKSPININGVEYLPCPKIGFVSRYIEGNENAKELIRFATSALIQIRGTRHPYIAYNEKEDNLLQNKFKLMSDLPRALKNSEEIRLYFQPIIDSKSEQCIELECLLRWKHPELGNISPFSIISWIEETPLMQDLTLRVIDLAIEAAQVLSTENMFPKIAVNLSCYDLYFDKIHDKLKLATLAISSGQLIAEITETALIKDLDTIAIGLKNLRDLGINIRIDDFGVGQSSLSYLTKLPAHSIKLDQSFLRQIEADPANLKISAGITTIAKELGFDVIIEGVECAKDYQITQYIQPSCIQGYHIAKPMPISKVVHWLKCNQFKQEKDVKGYLTMTTII